MKKLSRSEMKKVFGGNVSPGDAGCPAACVKAGSDGTVTSGTCSLESITVNHVTLSSCECSISGGGGCASR